MQGPKCKICGEHHFGPICPVGKSEKKRSSPKVLNSKQPVEAAKRFKGVTYGRSPAMGVLPEFRAYNALPMEERVRASAAFVRDRLAAQECPVCGARRAKEAARAKRYRARQKERP